MGLIGEAILPVEVSSVPPEICEPVNMKNPSFLEEDIEFKYKRRNQFYLIKMKTMVEENLEDLNIRRAYLSMLKFFNENKESFLTVDSYTEWKFSCEEIGLSTVEEIRNFLESEELDYNTPSFYFGEIVRRRPLEV